MGVLFDLVERLASRHLGGAEGATV